MPLSTGDTADKSSKIGPQRRAKADLAEQPPVAGEVDVLTRQPPTLAPARIVVSPEAAESPQTPLHAQPGDGPITGMVTRPRLSPVLASAASSASVSTTSPSSASAAESNLTRDPTAPMPVLDRERSAPAQERTQLLPITRSAAEPAAPLSVAPSGAVGRSASAKVVSAPAETPHTVPQASSQSAASRLRQVQAAVGRPYDPEKERKTELVEILPVKPADPLSSPRPLHPLRIAGALVAAALGVMLGGKFLPQLGHRGESSQPVVQGTQAPTGSAADPAALLGRIDRAVDIEDWHAALGLIGEGLKDSPQNPALLERKGRAEAELRNQMRYQGFLIARQHHNDAAALALFAEIPGESLYKAKAGGEVKVFREAYIGNKLAEARAARRQGQCKDVHRLTQDVLAADSGNEEARTLDSHCTGERRPPSAAPRETRDPSVGLLKNPFQHTPPQH